MSQLHRTIRYYVPQFLLLVALLGIAACDDNSTDPGDNTGGVDTTLTDNEIMHIARTANQGEVLTNQPAISKATNDSLRQFAQMMVTEHTKMVQRFDSLASAMQMTPVSNQISVTLNNSAQGTVTKLNALNGSAFDMAFLEAQHTMHHHVLDMLDYTLIPKAQNAGVRTLLTQMRASVQMHLDHIRAMMM